MKHWLVPFILATMMLTATAQPASAIGRLGLFRSPPAPQADRNVSQPSVSKLESVLSEVLRRVSRPLLSIVGSPQRRRRLARQWNLSDTLVAISVPG